MCNNGPDTNGSCFIILTEPYLWLDNKHVVFGRVSKGMEYVYLIESFGNDRGKPMTDIIITDCGEIK